MTTDIQHNELLTELRAIRAALEINPRAVATAPSASSPTVLPLPEKIIQNAAEITVHFGKNIGLAIGTLNEKQLLWYGADRDPQLKKDGTPFPPRELDVLLKNACRTLWHQRTGTIPSTEINRVATQSVTSDDETIPF
jgi:hypothetical protein